MTIYEQQFMNSNRREELEAWARLQCHDQFPDDKRKVRLTAISNDASFRRYFRFQPPQASEFILVDAPPEHEQNEAFIKVSQALLEQGLTCPKVLAADLSQGFLLVTDLGDATYLKVITEQPDRVASLYTGAVQSLMAMQNVKCDLPAYDETLLQTETALFPDWFLEQYLQMTLSVASKRLFRRVDELLVKNALAQPQVFVHRDYHSRNLMLVAGEGPGILDFQDAVIGPITYDLVSLFKDCYYRFDRQVVVAEVDNFRALLATSGRLQNISTADFLKWFDLMGVQRHLKCVGIFSRLHIRDGKPGYLMDIPLLITYLTETCAIYPELEAFGNWLETEVAPVLKTVLATTDQSSANNLVGFRAGS